MSKYINEIIKDIKTNPETWKRYSNDGLQKDNIIISQTGNGSKYFMFWGTSIIKISIDKKEVYGLTWRDIYRIEEIVLWWMRNASLSMMQG